MPTAVRSAWLVHIISCVAHHEPAPYGTQAEFQDFARPAHRAMPNRHGAPGRVCGGCSARTRSMIGSNGPIRGALRLRVLRTGGGPACLRTFRTLSREHPN